MGYIIDYYGITQDPAKEYILIMTYANGGDLHSYLQDNFNYITWANKVDILLRISNGYLYYFIYNGDFLQHHG